jgi:hypothetical protein
MKCSAAVALAVVSVANAQNVLFMGNSFTFVQDLPHMFQKVAKSFGFDPVVDNSTIGGCTLFYQMNDSRTDELLQKSWDVIVLQDYSQLPTIKAAREKMTYPAVETIASRVSTTTAKVMMYDTWGYINGTTTDCPTSGPAECFPIGTNADLTGDCATSHRWRGEVDSFDCMTYALARAYMGAFDHGAVAVAPCGMAWEVARNTSGPAAACRAAVDAEYASPFGITLPLQIKGQTKATDGIQLYRYNGKDKHPSPAGQYLNALVFFAMVYDKTPIGDRSYVKIKGLSAADALGLQQVAHGVVMQHRQHWFKQ